MIPTPPRPDMGLADEPGWTPTETVQPADRPLSTWNLWVTFGMIFLCYGIASFAAVPVYLAFGSTMLGGAAGVSELLQAAVTDLVTLGLLIWWLSVRHREWRAAIRLTPINGKRIREVAIGAGLGVCVLIVATIASVLILDLMHAIGGGSKPSLPDQVRGDLSTGGLIVFALTACVVAPITEEFVFRGLIFRTIRDRHRFLLAAAVSAVLFGAVHFVPGNPWQDAVALQATMVFTGFGLASIYEWRGNLSANVAAHSAFNLVAVLTVTAHAFR